MSGVLLDLLYTLSDGILNREVKLNTPAVSALNLPHLGRLARNSLKARFPKLNGGRIPSVDLQLPLTRKSLPNCTDCTPPNAEASALRLDVELRELIDDGFCRGRISDESKPYGMVSVLNDECVPTRLGPIGVEVRVGGRGGRTAGNILIAAKFEQVFVK